MEYIYTVMWLLAGLILIFKLGRENKIFYFTGGFFLVLGIWWLLDILLTVKMFEGALGILIKVLTGVVLAILLIYFIRHYMVGRKKQKEEEKTKPESISENKNW